MYGENFGYVEVTMDKSDYMLYQLIDDLEGVCSHLYPTETKNSVVYKGLIPRKEVRQLGLLIASSPYGSGYKIIVDNGNIYDFLKKDKYWMLGKLGLV